MLESHETHYQIVTPDGRIVWDSPATKTEAGKELAFWRKQDGKGTYLHNASRYGPWKY